MASQLRCSQLQEGRGGKWFKQREGGTEWRPCGEGEGEAWRVDTPKCRGSPETLGGCLLPLSHLLPIPPHPCNPPLGPIQVKSTLP